MLCSDKMATYPAMDLVADHCDIEERLGLIPPSARVRGLYFRVVESRMKRDGLLPAYRELFPNDRWSAMTMYPLGPWLLRLACGGALIASPERLHEGIHEICRGNAVAFANSILGKTMLRLLSRDPVRLSEQALAARRLTHQYGHWEIAYHGPRCIEMIYREEYAWIESVMAGAARGTYEACGLEPEMETRLNDRFNGSTVIRW
jgi:uncharacterized protein (TIGR02265 family)